MRNKTLLLSALLALSATAFAQVSSPTGKINGHEYVDLGLSVLWATCNVGASSPEEYGDYFAWGETSTKSSYVEGNSKTYGKEMGCIAGDPNYDAARANWGGSWRMPTASEMNELVNKCYWEWTTIGGHNGFKVRGPNWNSIFLPAAGDCLYASGPYRVGDYGRYWVATTDEGRTRDAYSSWFEHDSRRGGCGGGQSRYRGFSVRAVSEKTPQTTQATQTTQPSKPTTGTINGHEYVDLGLSVKWATCNVGASSPEGYGGYYAWGETQTKSSYTKTNCKTWSESLGCIAGNPSYDAARANWGGTWRLPTQKEMEELTYCQWTWTTMDGVEGYKVTGPNGNSIFLPAAGRCVDTSLYNVRDAGLYWSATPADWNLGSAFELGFASGRPISRGWEDRYEGISVRAVSK